MLVPTRKELAAAGRAARHAVPPAEHGKWKPARDRPDPVSLLEEQGKSRVPEVLPIRYGRMLASPGAFYRGGALIMADDLAATRSSGFTVQLGGDAHLSNFGLFASPERNLLFDITDFDETLPGPWEWDVKRLSASLVVAARDRGFARKQGQRAVEGAIDSYHERMDAYTTMDPLDVYYERVDATTISTFVAARARPYLQGTVQAAVRNDAMRELPKLTEVVQGKRRIIDRPPTIEHLPMVTPVSTRHVLDAYRASLPKAQQDLLNQFQVADAALKVVGVGSVGLLDIVALLLADGGQFPLFLQVKQAEASVLERYLRPSTFATHGQRVVEGQRCLQAASDIFLGWAIGDDGRHLYVRQLVDEKGSAVVEAMTPADLVGWARLCGWALARGHAQAGNAAAIAAYIGGGGMFTRAMVSFSEAYADQNEKDYQALQAAAKAGRIIAREDT